MRIAASEVDSRSGSLAANHAELPLSIVVVTGASGAGKTAAVSALEALALPSVQCFHFDSIGVPSDEVMERDHGGPERWQAWATNQWLTRLSALDDGTRVAVLDAQTRPSTVLAAADAGASWHAQVVLLDCAPDVRAARLCGPRGQPELATPRMESWAAYLRGQADALGLPVIDTTELTIADVAQHLQALVQRYLVTGRDRMAAEWTRLATFGSGLEADIARARLEEAEIPVQLRGQQTGAFGPSFQGFVPGGVDLYVPSPELEHAQELLGHSD